MEKKRYTFVFMGVSGSGKSVVAESISRKLNVPFLDGDILHSRSNINKMASGNPLDDTDRQPWLEALNSAIYAMQHISEVSVLVCSALKEKYRQALRDNNQGVCFIYLKGDFDLIVQRLENRSGHFFKPEMLRSQFAILEEPSVKSGDTCVIDISKPLDEEVNDAQVFIHKIITS